MKIDEEKEKWGFRGGYREYEFYDKVCLDNREG